MRQEQKEPEAMNAFEVAASVRFGNDLAAKIDQRNGVTPGARRYAAAIRHIMEARGRQAAAATAERLTGGCSDTARAFIDHLSKTRPDDITRKQHYV